MSNEAGQWGYLRNQQAYEGKGVLYVDISRDRKTIKLHAPTEPVTKMMRQKTYAATIQTVEGKDVIVKEEVVRTAGDNLPYDRPSLADIEYLAESENTGTNTHMTPDETRSVIDRLIGVFTE